MSLLSLATACRPAWAQAPTDKTADAGVKGAASAPPIETLLGRWTVDLRPAPGDAPYEQAFEVTSVDAAARRFEGRFYNTPIEWARVNRAWGELLIGFVTRDQGGPYHHVAVLRRDAQGLWLDGSSQHVERNLLMPWRARPKA